MPQSLPVTGNTEFTRPENRAYFPALDGVRALAFLMVVGQHYISLPWGWAGVNIFFVLSGFLITGILFDSRDDVYRVRNFYIRRTLRIFPLYYGVFLALLLTTPFLHWDWNWGWLAWLFYLGNYLPFLHPHMPDALWNLTAYAQIGPAGMPSMRLYLGHFWSLCVEEQFYLCWPWVVFLVYRRRALLWICGASVVLVPLARVWANHVLPENMLQAAILCRATPFEIDSLLLGGLAALWYRGTQRDMLLRASSWIFWACTATTAAYFIHGLKNHTISYLPLWQWTWGLSFINLYAVALLLMVLQPGSFLYRLFKLYPLRWLGRISYGAYIFHDIFHVRIANLFGPQAGIHIGLGKRTALYLTVVVISCVLAWLSFSFYESPFLNLKERWTIRGVRKPSGGGSLPA